MAKFVKLGIVLKKKRVEKGLTQMELAEHLGYTSPQFVSNWERGMCSPAFNALPTLAKVLSVGKKEMIDLILDETRTELEANFSRRASRRA